jgi:hypothetical protein
MPKTSGKKFKSMPACYVKLRSDTDEEQALSKLPSPNGKEASSWLMTILILDTLRVPQSKATSPQNLESVSILLKFV